MQELPKGDLTDWELLLRFLPQDWEEMGRESGALQRLRGFASTDRLLRTLLLYLVEGRSLRETALRVRQAGLAEVSPVAVWKRLAKAGEWFRLMNEALLAASARGRPVCTQPEEGRRVRLVDGTSVSEPGKTGSSWRIHYSLELTSLRCDGVHIIEKNTGETFKNFEISPGDILIADRVYANAPGITHVLSSGADVLVRLPYKNVALLDGEGRRVDLLAYLRTLSTAEIGEWPLFLSPANPCGEPTPVRVCAIKKSQAAAEASRKKTRRQGQKGPTTYTPSQNALEAAGYVTLFTTLPNHVAPSAQLLQLYRARWQVELVFKRLKSILGLGHLPKQEPTGARAWLQGKLFVATLVETLIAAGDAFFPWGYPICLAQKPMARDHLHV